MIDVSGSMKYNMDNAKLAARIIVDTFSNNDFVGVVAFNHEAKALNSNKVVRATHEVKNQLKEAIDNLEGEITESKTKNFLNICMDCNIKLEQKVLVIVSKKTTPLKLATRNIKNVESISASSLNTLSLLKAKQLIVTPLAINDIKEIYCD